MADRNTGINVDVEPLEIKNKMAVLSPHLLIITLYGNELNLPARYTELSYD